MKQNLKAIIFFSTLFIIVHAAAYLEYRYETKKHETYIQAGLPQDSTYKQKYGKEAIQKITAAKYSIALLSLGVVFFFYRRQREQSRLLEQLKYVIDHSTLVSKTDPKGRITYANDEFVKLSGYNKNELLGKPHNIIRHPDMDKEAFTQMWRDIRAGKTWRGIVKNRKKDGSSYTVDARIFPILDGRGKIKEYIAIRHDISEIMNPKRQLLEDIKSARIKTLFIVQMINHENIKSFYGIDFAQKLEDLIDQKSKALDFVKNYALPEGYFAFTSEESLGQNALENALRQIAGQTYSVDNTTLEPSFSAAYSHSGENMYEDCTLGLKKVDHQRDCVIDATDFTLHVKQQIKQNFTMIQTIKSALKDKRVISHFQPIVDNTTMQIAKYESLVRLQDKNGDVISPFYFLDVAKQAAYYKQITQEVIKNSFDALEMLPAVTINLASQDLEDKQTRAYLLDLVSQQRYRNRVTFEMLEDEGISDFGTIKSFIRQVKAYGVTIAIDDFGSGYSNYERLVDFAPDILKIDAGLIKNIDQDEYARSIVESIVLFARERGIQTVAEFVSSQEILAIVKEIGIDYSQGFEVGKPAPL